MNIYMQRIGEPGSYEYKIDLGISDIQWSGKKRYEREGEAIGAANRFASALKSAIGEESTIKYLYDDYDIGRIYESRNYACLFEWYEKAAQVCTRAFLDQDTRIQVYDDNGDLFNFDVTCEGYYWFIDVNGEEVCRTNKLAEAVCWVTALLEKESPRGRI